MTWQEKHDLAIDIVNEWGKGPLIKRVKVQRSLGKKKTDAMWRFEKKHGIITTKIGREVYYPKSDLVRAVTESFI